MQKKHYFLLAALVVYQRDKLERQKPLNILIPSDTATVNRSRLRSASSRNSTVSGSPRSWTCSSSPSPIWAR